MKVLVTSTATLSYADHLLRVTINENAFIGEVELGEQFEARKELVSSDDYVVLTDGRNYYHTAKVARDLLATALNPQRRAHAILLPGLTAAMMARLYITVHKPKTPTRVFSNESEALDWLSRKLRQPKPESNRAFLVLYPGSHATEFVPIPPGIRRLAIGPVSETIGNLSLVLITNTDVLTTSVSSSKDVTFYSVNDAQGLSLQYDSCVAAQVISIEFDKTA